MAAITYRIYSAHLLDMDGVTMDDVKRYETDLRAALEAEYGDEHEVAVERIDRTSGAGSGVRVSEDCEDQWRMEERVEALANEVLSAVLR